jgi:hypothetical protein
LKSLADSLGTDDDLVAKNAEIVLSSRRKLSALLQTTQSDKTSSNIQKEIDASLLSYQKAEEKLRRSLEPFQIKVLISIIPLAWILPLFSLFFFEDIFESYGAKGRNEVFDRYAR